MNHVPERLCRFKCTLARAMTHVGPLCPFCDWLEGVLAKYAARAP